MNEVECEGLIIESRGDNVENVVFDEFVWSPGVKEKEESGSSERGGRYLYSRQAYGPRMPVRRQRRGLNAGSVRGDAMCRGPCKHFTRSGHEVTWPDFW